MLMERILHVKDYIKQRSRYLYEAGRILYTFLKFCEQNFWKILKKVKINILYLEFTSVCNLNCRFCTLNESRKKGFLKKKFLIKILEDIRKNKISIKELSLHFGGETTLHPNLIEFLKIIAKYKKQIPNFPKTDLLTNAVILTKSLSKKILETEALDSMRFSIDGGNKEKYEHIRRGARWEIVLKNLNDFLDLNKFMGKNIETEIFSIRAKEGKSNLSPEFIKLIKRVNRYMPRDLHNFIGDIDVGFKLKPRRWLCHYILKDFAVFWDGRVSSCCADLNGRCVLGDLTRHSIKEIFFGEKRLSMIKNLFWYGRKKISPCSTCSL